MDGGKQNERGKMMRRAVGMAGKMAGRQTKSLLNKPLQATQPVDSPPGTGLKTHGPQMAGLAANNQPQMTSASRRAGKWGECSCWHSGRRVQTYLSVHHGRDW